MQFRIIHLLHIVTLFAIFFGLRGYWLLSEIRDAWIIAPITLAVTFGVVCGKKKIGLA